MRYGALLGSCVQIICYATKPLEHAVNAGERRFALTHRERPRKRLRNAHLYLDGTRFQGAGSWTWDRCSQQACNDVREYHDY